MFADNTLESITIPFRLTMAEPNVFKRCKHVRRIEFLEGREIFGNDADSWNELFRDCGVEEVVLPSTLRKMSPEIFKGCDSLKIVWVADGCPIDIRKSVTSNVEVC